MQATPAGSTAEARRAQRKPRLLVALFRDAPGVVGRLIRWQTRSKYSHAALVLTPGWLPPFDATQERTAPAWEVIEAREFEGVRLTAGLVQGEATVDLYEVWLGARYLNHEIPDIYRWAIRQIGKGYDYTMVARFVSRRQASRRSSGKWFCSELVFAAFQQAGIDLLARTEPWEVSPGMLARSPLLQFHSTISPQKETKDPAREEFLRAMEINRVEPQWGF